MRSVSLHEMLRQITTALHSLGHAWGIGVLSLVIFAPREQALAEVTSLQVAVAVLASLGGARAGFLVLHSLRFRQVLVRAHPINFFLVASTGFLFGALAYAQGLLGLWPYAFWFFPASTLETLRLLLSQLRKQSAGSARPTRSL